MAEVRLVHVHKVFDNGAHVLHDITMEVGDGEFVVLLGPSGCGKTTVLRLIAGLEDITTGEIFIGGRRVNDVPPKDRDIAMVFQDYALYPHMTVYENIAFGLRMRGMARAELQRRVVDTARVLDILDLLQRKPHQVSGGERQRVALARAIVREPKVFLLDEPLSNLDAKLRGHMRAELHRLYRSLGATIIYVTHDQTEAMTLGTRIVVLRDGVVQQVDTPRGVYEKPVNTFVASFIGTPPMNLFPACLVQEQGEFLLRHQDGGLALPAAKASAAHLRPWLGSTVIAGIRPEHACLHTASPAMGKGLPGTVEMVERTGAESFVAVRTGYGSMVVRVPPDLPVSLSSPVLLTFDAEHVHLFDAGSQMRIL